MISKVKRVPLRAFFAQKGARRASSEHFSLTVAANRLPHNRYAAIVGIAVDKRATRRHHIKRKMLACMLSAPENGYDIVATARKGTSELSLRALREEITKLLKTIIS